MADAFTAADLIEARLRAAWTATPTDRLRFDNNAALLDMSGLAAFCQAEIAWGEDRPYIGDPATRLNRIDGVLLLHCMVPRQAGIADLRAMHRNARAALANQTFGGVYMQGYAPNRGRPSDEHRAYYGSTGAIPFYYLYRDAD